MALLESNLRWRPQKPERLIRSGRYDQSRKWTTVLSGFLLSPIVRARLRLPLLMNGCKALAALCDLDEERALWIYLWLYGALKRVGAVLTADMPAQEEKALTTPCQKLSGHGER